MTTPQAPIGSGFGASATAAEVIQGIDLTGKNVIVTGGYSGIGLETVRAFRSAGATVIVPARDIPKAKASLADMPDVELDAMDLLDPASIDAFASRFLSRFDKLHILVNNAGIMATPLARDERGNESQFAANHLGHFQLACRLWPALVRAEGARVVALSSYAHRRAGIDFRDLNFERREYNPWAAYGQAKTANALFAVALDAIGQPYGVRAFSVHPGGIATDLQRHLTKAEIDTLDILDTSGKPIIDPDNNRKSPEQGAATSVWCATSPMLDGMGGVYCADCEIARALPSDDSTEMHGVRPRAADPVAAGRLWQLSEQLTGATLAE
ncbi:SDR family NAD(P)-dependent oxidoreductase [Paenibacillus sp. MWE-103]|uniref:SDR family NAD(P)-dependent oxidoreductase n=1 Tax=Paenibacillus artemisiicola TaxID=1172618 RepID=A0ABS3W5K7_9BACL|nr:oxidoreductase [Paenibacillus artemisiicola]MBO7743425.1 SDR family NAD(P)-dependent oxidoreductase [Paenibacillus artemisiicola]